jgi:hypothetical protein
MLGFWVIGVAVLFNTINKLYTKFAVTNTCSYTFLWILVTPDDRQFRGFG